MRFVPVLSPSGTVQCAEQTALVLVLRTMIAVGVLN
jgi:hypothetical protein